MGSAMQPLLEWIAQRKQERYNQANLALHQQQVDTVKQNVESEIKAREAATQHAHDLLDQQHDLNVANVEHLKTASAAQLMQLKLAVSSAIARGEPVPGMTSEPNAPSVMPGATNVQLPPAPVGPNPNASQVGQATEQPSPPTTIAQNITHTIPLGEGVAPITLTGLASPEDYARRAATLEAITKEPGIQAKLREQAQQQAEETKRFLSQITLTQGFENEREKLRLANELTRTRMMNNTSMSIAQLPYTFFLNSLGANANDPQSKVKLLQPYLNAADNADMGVETGRREFEAKGMGGVTPAIQAMMLQNGSVWPTDKQVATKQALAQLPGVVQNIDELINMLPAGTYTGFGSKALAGIKGLSTIGNSDIDAKEKELELNIGTIAKQVGGDQGQRLQSALLTAAHGGFMPSASSPRASNVQVRNNFVHEIDKIVDAALGSLPTPQRNRIKQSMGLSTIPMMAPDGSYMKPSQPTSSPINGQSGTTPKPTLTPQALDLLKKLNIQPPQ